MTKRAVFDPDKLKKKCREDYLTQWAKHPLLTWRRTWKARRFAVFGNFLRRLYPSPPQRFLLICRARSGSNYLLTLLDSHPRVRHLWEPFGEHTLRQLKQLHKIQTLGSLLYFEQRLQRVADEQVVGFKILYHQLNENYSEEWGVPSLALIKEAIIADKEIKVIHLKRQNILHSLVSGRMAMKTNQFIMFDEKQRQVDVQISLTPAECEREFKNNRQEQVTYDKLFADHPLLTVNYEALSANPQIEGERLLAFLGLKQRRLQAFTVKQNVRPMSDIVTNYAELKAHFEKTVWASFFD